MAIKMPVPVTYLVHGNIFSISNRQISEPGCWSAFAYLFFLGFAFEQVRLEETQNLFMNQVSCQFAGSFFYPFFQ